MRRVLLVAVLAAVGCNKSTPPTSPAPPITTPTAPARQTMTREEFRAKIMGKAPGEVIAAVGKPDKTQDDSTWYYNRKTTDPITSKVDGHAQVIFENGVVVRINH